MIEKLRELTVSMPIAIVAGAALIALTILFVFRWEVISGPGAGAIRLDRWNGQVFFCSGPDLKTLEYRCGSGSFRSPAER
jgi:hypothetical protein